MTGLMLQAPLRLGHTPATAATPTRPPSSTVPWSNAASSAPGDRRPREGIGAADPAGRSALPHGVARMRLGLVRGARAHHAGLV
ncbi:hypothetical protein ACFU6I_03990 [Streptomyces sp. NPDC057486]|uniref:hypothetical protein n=1 Tax=Streptomyces sp. NPDC057486 TaxID=3346145 RepID=UPI0036B338A1